MNLSESPLCELCPHGIEEDLQHAMLDCDHNAVVNDWIIAVLIDIDPGVIDSDLTALNILTLNLDIEADKKLAVICFLSLALKEVWETRQKRRQMSLFKIKAQIQAEVAIMKRSKHEQSADIIELATNFSL